jgi:hypothetical protein
MDEQTHSLIMMFGLDLCDMASNPSPKPTPWMALRHSSLRCLNSHSFNCYSSYPWY